MRERANEVCVYDGRTLWLSYHKKKNKKKKAVLVLLLVLVVVLE